jgi:ABC-type sugar transport system ATPase subunit
MTVGNRMAILEAGSVRQLGQPADVYENPNCRYVAGNSPLRQEAGCDCRRFSSA